MELKEAIQHCRAVAAGYTEPGKCPECAADHTQLADWLEELARYRGSRLTPEDLMENTILQLAAKDLDVTPERLHGLALAERDGLLVALTPDKARWVNAILDERDRQDKKWGHPQENTYCEWASILAEEVGELAKELNELNFGRGSQDRMKAEAVQVAAVALSLLEQSGVAAKVTARAAVALGRSTNRAPDTEKEE